MAIDSKAAPQILEHLSKSLTVTIYETRYGRVIRHAHDLDQTRRIEHCRALLVPADGFQAALASWPSGRMLETRGVCR